MVDFIAAQESWTELNILIVMHVLDDVLYHPVGSMVQSRVNVVRNPVNRSRQVALEELGRRVRSCGEHGDKNYEV